MLNLLNLLNLFLAVTPIHQLTDSPFHHRDTLIKGDTATVITTVCAPICSSIARVYAINNKEWLLTRTITGDSTMVFPEAYFEEQQLRWRDNTPEMLDDEEKKSSPLNSKL